MHPLPENQTAYRVPSELFLNLKSKTNCFWRSISMNYFNLHGVGEGLRCNANRLFQMLFNIIIIIHPFIGQRIIVMNRQHIN